MSLHVLANHMATKGRGPDSMLVHMTPAEVASLQALALKNGGSLTINPETGLPEAGFLKKLLPAIAGFALNAFLPGFGTAIGGALGLGGAAGTAIGLGGITGLATGSLSKGLMAGLGAYGGASLAGSVMGAGAVGAGAGVGAGVPADMAFNLESAGLGTANADIAGKAIQGIQPSAFDKLGAGFKAVSDAPGAFLKDNWKMGLAAASPLIADAMVPTTTKMPTAQNTGYIRPFQYDANTRTVKAMDPVLASEWGARQFPDFIRKTEPPAGLGQQLPPGMATGGIVALADGGVARYFGGGLLDGVRQATDPAGYAQAQQARAQAEAQAYAQAQAQAQAQQAQAPQNSNDPYARYNTLSGQSKAAYDYLMGNTAGSNPAGLPTIAPRPVVSNTNTPPATTTTTTPATTTDPMKTQPVTGGGGGGGIGGGGGGGGGASVGNASSAGTDTSPTYSGFVPEPPNPNIPVVDLIPTPTTTPEPNLTPEPEPVPMPPDPYPYPEPEPEPPQVLPWEPPAFNYPEPEPNPYPEPEPQPEPVLPWEPPAFNYPEPEPLPYQGDPYDQPYVPPQGDPYDQPYVPYQGDPYDYVPVETDVPEPADYEVQPWENVDNSGYTDNSMAGDNSLYSGNNTYTGTASEPPSGLPDAFGSYPGEPTYVGSDGGGGDWWSDDGNSLDDDYDYAGNANGGLMGYANGGMMPRYALGGLGALGGYSDGGRLLKGPGDGVSDSIPATIGRKKQPARLADGEFVVPARIVSELGNGSTEAGARKLYAMMDRIQKARGKTVGKGKVAANSRSEKHLPA